VQEGKLACTSFPPWWDDVVRDAARACARGKEGALAFPHGGMMLFEMHSCLCKRES
jgi:hypothetical protein